MTKRVKKMYSAHELAVLLEQARDAIYCNCGGEDSLCDKCVDVANELNDANDELIIKLR